ncbi:hypothetical protein TNCV_516071 [Trichonephila clavipes]|nr:hypothetical protein TNCV_516071 [Trichonephila clavipes]
MPLHLTKIFALRVQFLDEGTKRSRFGLDMVSKEDAQVVQTVIRGFSPWQPLRCETVRCLGETGFSFSENVAVSSASSAFSLSSNDAYYAPVVRFPF